MRFGEPCHLTFYCISHHFPVEPCPWRGYSPSGSGPVYMSPASTQHQTSHAWTKLETSKLHGEMFAGTWTQRPRRHVHLVQVSAPTINPFFLYLPSSVRCIPRRTSSDATRRDEPQWVSGLGIVFPHPLWGLLSMHFRAVIFPLSVFPPPCWRLVGTELLIRGWACRCRKECRGPSSILQTSLYRYMAFMLWTDQHYSNYHHEILLSI